MKKWYKVFSPLVYLGSEIHQVVYVTDLNSILMDVIVLKEYESKEEMIKELKLGL